VLRLCIITGRQCKDNMSFSTIEFQPQYVLYPLLYLVVSLLCMCMYTIHNTIREEHTCFDLWCWPRRYLESGMILDYNAIMPLVTSEASVFVGTKPGMCSSSSSSV